MEKPFPQEEELAEKSARLAELNAQLDVDEKSHDPEQDEEEQEDAPCRPSVLAALEEKSDKPEPVKPFRSLSAYIRKMALDGYCLNLDLPQLRRMAYLLQMCSNNLNQYAKAANENGRVYAADMEDLRQRLDELIDICRKILARLAEL